MTIRLIHEKAKEIKELCCKYVTNREITIREFAQIVGKLVAAEPGVEYAPIYIKSLEIEKDRKLKESNGNFESNMVISNESVKTLSWWIENVESSFKPLVRKDPELVLKTDSSKTGWGGVIDNTTLKTSGFWSYEEKKLHIHFLELKAVFLSLKCFCSTKTNIHIRLYLDNMVAGKVVQKLIAEETELTLIAPLWTSQHWLPKMLHHIVQDSFIIPSQKSQPLLTQPTNPQMNHPLKKLILGVFRLSGKLWKIQDYQKKLQTLSFHPGELQHKDNIGRISQNGVHFVVNDKLIYLRQLKWI